MSIHRNTIPLFKVYMSEDVDKPLLETIHSGWIGEGPKVEEFEKNLKAYFGNPNVVTVNNGNFYEDFIYYDETSEKPILFSSVTLTKNIIFFFRERWHLLF